LYKVVDWKTISKRSGIPHKQLEDTEKTSTTHRRRRVAEFDWELLRRASALNGPTDIALAFVDYLSCKNEDARRFEQLDAATINFIEELQRVAAAPVSLISTRFDFRSIIDRRAW
jgi:adenylosuccinate synthase